MREKGQGTVEWVGLLAVIALLFLAMVAAGARVPGEGLARAVASRLLCAVALAEQCGDEPTLIATYGDEVGRLVKRHAPALLMERGSRALPVDFRRCREPACADGSDRGLVARTDGGLPVTAFVRVIDCRGGSARFAGAAATSGATCAGPRRGSLYIQYWFYYADSATLRGVPVAAAAGYHRDDWESLQIRIRPGGEVDSRASSHHGYNHLRGIANWGSDAGIGPLRDVSEALGARPRNGWGPAGGLLLVSGGSHAGNAGGFPRIDRIVPGANIRLIPLEPIAATSHHRFAVSPPWRKHAWANPEAAGTD